MSDYVCPLCQSSKHMGRARLLYGTPVCRKCYYRFANRRQLAYFVDWLAFNFLAFFLLQGLSMTLVYLNTSARSADAIFVLCSWVAFPMIFFLKDGFAGQSPGKAIMGVQAQHSETGEPIGFTSSFKRNLPLIIPFMPLIIAFLLQKGHRLGDGWARSKVVWKKYATHPVFTGRNACEHCGYDLTGNTSGTCPECGASLVPPVMTPAAPPTTPTFKTS